MFDSTHGLYVAHGPEGPISICGRMANRHGLIAGATGTGKTVSLQVLAETFSAAGVPCFLADMKGDLSGISQPGHGSSFIEKRRAEFGLGAPAFSACPVRFYDVFGQQGHPMRSTVSNMGPQLLSRLMELNDTQSGILDILFRVADERGLLLIDLKDFRAMLAELEAHASELRSRYGNITSASIGAIQRALLSLENQGGNAFFGEPAFDIRDLIQQEDGKGLISILAADRLMLAPKLYSTFLLWLLSDLYATLPEVGDTPLPKLVFFFDEAHTLFMDTAPALVSKIEQVVRLIRSKGVGVYFITQNPTDIPDSILGQLGNRVQHALRAYTPRDQKAVRAAAATFRPNPAFQTENAITSLETGEALVSFLDEKGAPAIVQRARMLYPLSQIGAITKDQRTALMQGTAEAAKYDQAIDRESAYELLAAAAQQQAEAPAPAKGKGKDSPANKGSKAAKIGGAVLSAALSAALTSVTRSAGTAVANTVTGKKSKSTTGKNIASKALTNATSSALRTLTRSLLGNLIK
ncbi:MAG: DUF853 family protein [Bacteroidales bacterium]|nr:DUF853 family protein [Bacteroidales bacterium]